MYVPLPMAVAAVFVLLVAATMACLALRLWVDDTLTWYHFVPEDEEVPAWEPPQNGRHRMNAVATPYRPRPRIERLERWPSPQDMTVYRTPAVPQGWDMPISGHDDHAPFTEITGQLAIAR